MNKTPEEMTNEELISAYKSGYAHYQSWSNSTDGSDGACWDYEVRPYLQEIRKRGLEI